MIIDVKGTTLSLMTADYRTLLHAMVTMDQDNYPETLGKVMVVNAPFVFPLIWGIIKPWVDPITAAKVNIHGPDFADVVRENVGAENLPSNYFGDLPPLTKEIHPYEEGMMVHFGVNTTTAATDGTAVANSPVLKMSGSGDGDSASPVTVFAQPK